MPDFNFYNPQIQPMPSMSLGDVMNIANSAQAYRSGQIQLQQQQQKFAEQQAVSNAIRQNPELFMDENGRFDQTKINANINKFAPTYAAELAAPYVNLAAAQVGVDQARNNLTQDKLEQVSRPLATLAFSGEQNKDKYKAVVTNMLKNFAGDKEMTNLVANINPILDSIDSKEGPVSSQIMGLVTHLSTPVATQQTLYGQTASLQDIPGQGLSVVKTQRTPTGQVNVNVAKEPVSKTPQYVGINPITGLPNYNVWTGDKFEPMDYDPSMSAYKKPVQQGFVPAMNLNKSESDISAAQTPTIKAVQDSKAPAQNALQLINDTLKVAENAKTGKGSDWINTLGSLASTYGGDLSAGNEAAMAEILNKNMAGLEQMLSQTGNTQTVAELNNIKSQLPGSWAQPKTIQSALNRLAPLARYASNYASGLDAALSKYANDPKYKNNQGLIKNAYDTAVRSVYDPEVSEYFNALVNDPANGKVNFLRSRGYSKAKADELEAKTRRYANVLNGNIK